MILFKGFVKADRILLFSDDHENQRVFIGTMLFSVYQIFIHLLGFLLASIAFVMIMDIYLDEQEVNRKKIMSSGLLALVLTGGAYVVFVELQFVSLPEGLWSN